MADLLTLAEYRAAAGIDATDTRDDAKFSVWLPMVSAAIRNFTERDFGAPIVTESRTYEYDGSGFLDIDDASEITAVSVTYPLSESPTFLDEWSWAAKPPRRDDAPVYYYLELYGGSVFGSPEMGFTRNLDVYAREYTGHVRTSRMTVTGTWGWPVVPADVKMAAVWTLQEWMARPSGDALTSEAIEGWSRSWGGRMNGGVALAIPARARDILIGYAKTDF